MHCPHCHRPLWRDFVPNIYHPRPGEQRTHCVGCRHKATYALPEYLAEEEYVWFGAGVIMLTLLGATAIDARAAIQLNAGVSIFLAWVGLIALLTWTRTRVR